MSRFYALRKEIRNIYDEQQFKLDFQLIPYLRIPINLNS